MFDAKIKIRGLSMPNETVYYYCFGPTDNDGVNVISYVSNVWAAKMAMLRSMEKANLILNSITVLNVEALQYLMAGISINNY